MIKYQIYDLEAFKMLQRIVRDNGNFVSKEKAEECLYEISQFISANSTGNSLGGRIMERLSDYQFYKSESARLTEENEKLKETQLKETYDFHVESITKLNEQLTTQCTYMSDLQKKNESLKEGLEGLISHCQDYGLEEESLAILMAVQKAREVLNGTSSFIGSGES